MSHIPEISKIRAIRYLTLQGGGVKGIGYVGVMEELQDTGVLAQLEEVAGSSAGGIVALLIAIGCTAEEIKAHMTTLNFPDFQDREGVGWVESTRLKDLLEPIGATFETIDEKLKVLSSLPGIGKIASYVTLPLSAGVKIAQAASSVMSGLDFLEQGMEINTHLGLYKGDVLSYWLASIVAQKTGNPNLTFAELAKLNSMPNSPFKRLTLTGSNLTTQRLDYFNASDYPDMPIIEAARISASFPGAFQPVRRRDKNGVMSVYVDGGLVENLPDVFNRAPYISVEEKTNTEALAVVLKSSTEEGIRSEINTLFDLGKALYKTARSERRAFERYGQNIAYIDTVGVDTLEFGLTKEKKEALVKSGKRSIQKTFQAILKTDEEINLRTQRTRELVRIRVALLEAAKHKKEQEEGDLQLLRKVTEEIDRRAKLITPDKLLKLYREENAILQRRLKMQHDNFLSEEELLDSCQQKLKEFNRVKEDLTFKLRGLREVEYGLQTRREEVLAAFHRNDFDNPFYVALNDPLLNRGSEQILQNRNRYALLEPDQVDQKEKLTEEYNALIRQRREHLLSLRDQFEKSKITSEFFNDLLRNCDTENFRIPNTSSAIRKYYNAEIKEVRAFVEEIKQEIQTMRVEYEGFKKTYQAYLADLKNTKSDKLSILIELRKEVNISLLKKSHFLARLNQKLSEKAPFFSSVITGFFKLVSLASFLTFLPFAIPVVAVAKGVRYFSSNPETQDTADRFINFFRKTDIDFEKRLLGFSKTTSQFVSSMMKSYTKDKSETDYIHRTFSEYLKNSGLSLQDILTKKPHETDKQFEERIKKIQNALKNSNDVVQISPRVKLKSEEVHDDLEAESHVQRFRSKVLVEEANYKSDEMIELTQQKNIKQIDMEYVNEIEHKLKHNVELSSKEVREYIKSLTALVQEIPKDVKKKYAKLIPDDLLNIHEISLQVKKGVELTDLEIKDFKEYIKTKKAVVKNRNLEEHKLFLDFEEELKLREKHVPMDYAKKTLESFIQRRKKHLEEEQQTFRIPSPRPFPKGEKE